MSANPYTVRRVAQQSISQRRAVAFLESTVDRGIDAGSAFSRLTIERERDLRNRFDHWIEWNVNDKYFHGWPGHPKYKDCFSFRWYEKGQRHRLYGFLIHPMSSTNPQFQVCVLVSHAIKTTEETDPRHLERAQMLSTHPLVVQAARQEFPEDKKGARRWLN